MKVPFPFYIEIEKRETKMNSKVPISFSHVEGKRLALKYTHFHYL